MRRERLVPVGSFVIPAVLVVLAAAMAYEATAALGGISLGKVPGAEPTGESYLVLAAVVALLGGAASSAIYARRSPSAVGSWPMLLAPSAVAFVSTRFYTFDPYYAPELRRFSEGRAIGGWIVALVVLGALACVLVRIRPRLGLNMSSAVLVLSAWTALIVAGGH
jgi:hypothetical protein